MPYHPRLPADLSQWEHARRFSVSPPLHQELVTSVTTGYGGSPSEALPFLQMALDEYGRAGAPLEVRVPWFPVTLWFVPDARHLRALVTEGVGRGRIWTAAELSDLLAGPGLALGEVRTIAYTKVFFGGEVVEVRGRRPERT